jgi:hypothetical protein
MILKNKTRFILFYVFFVILILTFFIPPKPTEILTFYVKNGGGDKGLVKP